MPQKKQQKQQASTPTASEVLQLVGVVGLILAVESVPVWALTFAGVLLWQSSWLIQIAEKLKLPTHQVKQIGLPKALELLKLKLGKSTLQGAQAEDPDQRRSWQTWRESGKQKYSILASGDPTKASLVSKIKVFQRLDTEKKHAWQTFCKSQVSKNRDPASYPADVLQLFLQDHVTIKDSLVMKIKGIQTHGDQFDRRSEMETKQAWSNFCESQEANNRDPARYPVDVLQQFVQDHLCEDSPGHHEAGCPPEL